MNPEARDLIRAVLDSPERAADASPAVVPAILGQLAHLQAIFLARLVTGGNGHSETVKPPSESDRFLTTEQAAELFAVAPRWLYRHAIQIPGARRLSRKCLRFSEAGLRRFMATRRA